MLTCYPTVGTLGVLVMAKKEGRLDKVRACDRGTSPGGTSRRRCGCRTGSAHGRRVVSRGLWASPLRSLDLTLSRRKGKKPGEVLVAEVTTTDLRKTRYQVESKDDISKTRQGYKIETADGGTARFSEEDVEPISVVGE